MNLEAIHNTYLQELQTCSRRVANVVNENHLSLQQKRQLLEEAAVFLHHLRGQQHQPVQIKEAPIFVAIHNGMIILDNIIRDVGYHPFPEWFPDVFTTEQIKVLHQRFDRSPHNSCDLNAGFMINP